MRRVGMGVVPVWLRSTGTRHVVCSRHKATLVLADVRPYNSMKSSTPGWLTDSTKGIRCFWLKVGAYSCAYIRTEVDITSAPDWVLRTMSAVFSQVPNYVFGNVGTDVWLAQHFGRIKHLPVEAINQRPPIKGEFERSSVSGEHHTHYRPEEIWSQIVIVGGPKVRLGSIWLYLARRMEGMNEAIVATFLMYLLTASIDNCKLLFMSEKLHMCDNVTVMISALKDMSTPLKAMQNGNLKDLSELFELQVLVNRGLGCVDWESERDHRTRPNTVEVAPEKVYDEAKKVFSMGIRDGFKYPKMSMDKYLDARWEWSPSGSVHSQYTEDKEFIAGEYRHRTKFVTLNSMSKHHIKKFMSSPPQIRAWPSTKYEWSKMRAIYGTDLRSMVIANFCMFRCEDVLRDKFPVGVEAEASRVHKKLDMILAGNETFCYDFDDFNAQHSTESMIAVLMAYRDVFYVEMSDDQVEAMNWTIDSLRDVEVVDTERGGYKMKGTLLSGWRLTTFMNSVLNYVYMSAASVFDTRGIVDSVHNGDDVCLAVKNVSSVCKVMKRMNDLNARAQATKCNVFSIGEFLRVDHKIKTKKGLGSQYLTRGCATAVHSRTESQEPTNALSLCSAHYTRVMELSDRSTMAAEPIMRLLKLSLNRVEEEFKLGKGVAMTYIKTHKVAGGNGNTLAHDVDVLIESRLGEPDIILRHVPKSERKTAIAEDLLPGIYDYAKSLCTILKAMVPLERIFNATMRGTRSVLEITKNQSVLVTDISRESKYKFARALSGMCKNSIQLGGIAKARFLGVPPLNLATDSQQNTVIRALGNVSDPLWALKVLF